MPEDKKKGGLFGLLRRGLARTTRKFADTVRSIFTFGRKLDDEQLEELTEALIAADFGPRAADRIAQQVQDAFHEKRFEDPEGLFAFLKETIKAELSTWDVSIHAAESGPTVVMVAGVNGSGKTTSIAKLAKYFSDQGKRVLLAAGDTYRAAAVEQLVIWADRVGVEIVKHQQGGDPAAVAFDACEAAKARGVDVLIVDTAGRLQTKEPLMR